MDGRTNGGTTEQMTSLANEWSDEECMDGRQNDSYSHRTQSCTLSPSRTRDSSVHRVSADGTLVRTPVPLPPSVYVS